MAFIVKVWYTDNGTFWVENHTPNRFEKKTGVIDENAGVKSRAGETPKVREQQTISSDNLKEAWMTTGKTPITTSEENLNLLIGSIML